MKIFKSPNMIFNFKHLKKNVLFIYIALVSPILLGQVKFKNTSNYLLFEDASTGEPILVYNDSMAVSGPEFSHHFKINFPKELNLNDFKNNQYQINGINYFVDNGCGRVLEFKNNTFKRIDNSFKHNNQYGGIPFQYKQTMYLWGGYGLFTHKNILTYYDFLAGEWLKQHQVNIEKVEPRSRIFSLIKDNNLYFFGGDMRSNHKNFETKNLKFNDVWRLDFKDFTLHKLQQHNDNFEFIKNDRYYYPRVQIENKIIHISTLIREIDIFKNTVKTYTFKNFKNIKSVVYHKASKNISFTYSIDGQTNGALSQPYEEFRGSLIKETPFYKDTFLTTLLKYTLYGLGILIAIFGFRHLYLRKKKRNFNIYYSKNTHSFYFKKTPIILNNLSTQVLVYFMNKQSEYFLLNELNSILTTDLDTDNYITINKRRERVLKELTLELSSILKTPQESIFSLRKNKFDKRLKEIKLNITIAVKK